MHSRTSDILGEFRNIILAAAKQHGARNVRVFGSFARGTEDVWSDIDFLVEMEAGRTLLDLIALEQSLTAYLGRPIDVVTEGFLSPYFRDQVLAEAVPL
jgi:uncharacterized protein